MESGRYRPPEIRERKTHEQAVALADGTRGIFVVNRSVFKGEIGGVLGLVTVLQDITRLRMSEKALEENEERYRIVTEQTGQLVYDNNLENQKLSLAGAVEEITGYSEENFMSGRIWWADIVHPEDLPAVLKQVTKIKSSPRAHNTEFEYRIKHKDGKTKWVNESCQKIPLLASVNEFYAQLRILHIAIF